MQFEDVDKTLKPELERDKRNDSFQGEHFKMES